MWGYLIIGILIFLGVCFIYWRFRKNFKFLKTPTICLVTGAPKTGKTLLCSTESKKTFKKLHRRWFFKSLILKLFRSKKKIEEPLYYTNCKASFGSLKSKKPHRLDKCIKVVELETLLRMKRYRYKSVIFATEASLVADSQFYNNQDMNIDLALWAKLVSHELRGGAVYLDTQSMLDLHYAFKRVCSNFYFIQKNVNFLGLFHVLWVREMISSDLGTNSFVDDIDTTTRKIIIPFWWHNRYDRYEFAKYTDDLEISDNDDLTFNKLISFNKDYVRKIDTRVKESEVKENV